MNKLNILIFNTVILLSFAQFSLAQSQKGQDIFGEAVDDLSGCSVSMPNENTIAIGALYNDGNGSNSGHVRVFDWDGKVWIQRGLGINGEASGDESGGVISMPDTITIAIGAIFNDGNGTNSGQVRIYTWDGKKWVQKGQDINGEQAEDRSGWSVSMPDSNTVAIGSPQNDGNGKNSGHVRIYTWNTNGKAWVQKGQIIEGERAEDQSGWSVSMSDSNTVAIGAPLNDENGKNSGRVKIYSWNGKTWLQKGQDIDGETKGDEFGWSISMSDSNTVAIAAIKNNGNGSESGHVQIYSWNGTIWLQKGNNIIGEATGDRSGFSIDMPNANTVAIGARENDGNGEKSGHVRIYVWNGIKWIQKVKDIDGKATNDLSGTSVSMPTENTVAIGAIWNDGNGENSGHVRVFEICKSTITTIKIATCDSSYTVPTGSATYYASGIYFDTLINKLNCDSILQIDLKFAKSSSILNITSCKSYKSPSGEVYANTGTYFDTLTNAVGCDSIITINYNRLSKTVSSFTVVECGDSYTVPSGISTYTKSGVYYDTLLNSNNCDSILEIDLNFAQKSFSTIDITSCIGYIASSGVVFTNIGTYFDTLTNALGCDSIIKIKLSIMNSDVVENGMVLDATLIIPNAFSPNGDGINDVFRIAYCGYKYFECSIYASTGQRLTTSYNPDALWNGNSNGFACPVGTYKYLIKATDNQGNTEIFSDTIKLLR